MENNYVLIDCGLIHKYLVKRDDIEVIENKTFFTVEIVKDLINYTVANRDGKLILSNGPETLTFKIVGDSKDEFFRYFLDEFPEFEDCSVDEVVPEDNKTLIAEKDIKIFPQYFDDGEFIKDKDYHDKFYWNEFGCWVINELGDEVFVHNDFIYKSR